MLIDTTSKKILEILCVKKLKDNLNYGNAEDNGWVLYHNILSELKGELKCAVFGRLCGLEREGIIECIEKYAIDHEQYKFYRVVNDVKIRPLSPDGVGALADVFEVTIEESRRRW